MSVLVHGPGKLLNVSARSSSLLDKKIKKYPQKDHNAVQSQYRCKVLVVIALEWA